MAGKNQVTLTFAGDSDQLERTFDKVGASSKRMGQTTDTSSRVMGAGFARLGRNLEKDLGFRVDKAHAGLSLLAGFVGGPFGAALEVGVLASDTLSTVLGIVSLANIKAAGAFVLSKAAMVAGAAVTGVMTAAQWALNLAMSANPIGLIVLALVGLAAAVIVAWKKSETFRTIVTGAFTAVRNAIAGAFNWVKSNWPLLLAILTGPIGVAVLVISKNKDKILGFFRAIPGAIAGFFSGVANTISAPFRAAFSGIKRAWNSTVGGKGFSVPSWVPGIGGKEFRIPRLHTGGTMPGAPGSEGLALLRAGEQVSPAGLGGGGRIVLELRAGGTALDQLLVEVLARAVRVRGGDVQVVLGGAQ